MRMLELFSGTGNMARAFKDLGYDTLTVDLTEKADIQADIKTLSPEEIVKALGGYPDIIWASPPCTQFSVASVGKHWKDRKPPTEGTELLSHTLRLIMSLQPKYWFIENPRGMMRKLNLMEFFPRRTFSFCQYGDNSMKPTDVWTNHKFFYPRMCKNGASCHESAPRGSRTGTQGKNGAKDRGAIPPDFCLELAQIC